jgi:hypothetical protein
VSRNSGVLVSVVALVVATMCVGTGAEANSWRPTSQLAALTYKVRYGDISLRVPEDWATYGTPPVVVLHAGRDHTDDGTITLEPFLSSGGTDAPAMSRYYHGPWKATRSAFGLRVEIGVTVSTVALGHGSVLFTEWARIPAYNIGVGLSGPGRTVEQALALTRAVLMTARSPA